MMEFEILGEIRDVETIATGRGVTSGAIWNARMAKAAGVRGKEEQSYNWPMGQSAKLRSTGLKRMGSGGRISKSRGYSDE